MSEFWNNYSGNCEDQNLLVCNTMWFSRRASEFRIKLLAHFSTLKIEAVDAAVTVTRVARVRHVTSHSTVIFLCITLPFYQHEICLNLWRTERQDHKYTRLRNLRFKFTAFWWRLLSDIIRCCTACLYKVCWLLLPKTVFVVLNWMKISSMKYLCYHTHRKRNALHRQHAHGFISAVATFFSCS